MSNLQPNIKVICRHKTPKEAEAFYSKRGTHCNKDNALAETLIAPASTMQASTTQASTAPASTLQDNTFTVPVFVDMINGLPAESRLPLLSELFSNCVSALFKCAVPKDFLCLAASAMNQLSIGGRTNVLYNLAKGMGTLRPDSQDPRFPINRMPMGLVEYAAQFFANDNLQQVKKKCTSIQ